MKTSGHLILYISENEDFELWRVLSQISPDDRAAFVKSALKKSLFTGNEARSTSANANWTKQHPVLQSDNSTLDNPINELALEGLVGSQLVTDEEKEALIFFDNEKEEGQDAQEDGQEDENADALRFDDLLQSSESSNTTIPGLSFLLANVIGEEQDENVIEFIRNNKTTSEDTI